MCEASTRSILFDIEIATQVMCSGLLFFLSIQYRGDEMIGLLTAAPAHTPGVTVGRQITQIPFREIVN